MTSTPYSCNVRVMSSLPRPGKQLLQSGLPCPVCFSSRSLAIYDDGGYCFKGCGHVDLEEYGITPDNPPTARRTIRMSDAKPAEFLDGEYRAHPERNLSLAAMERFGVKMSGYGDNLKIIYPYCDANGRLVAQKVRTRDCPKGYWVGNPREAVLFGQQLFRNGGKKLLFVEGENEPLAAFDMMGDWPCVSVKDGVDLTGKKAADVVREHYQFFEKFEEIYICFDNDDPGRVSALEAAKILPAGRVKLVHLTKHKDPNDYLMARDTALFKKEFWNAKTYTPAGLVAGADLFEEVMQSVNQDFVPYRWDNLNKLTYGIRKGEMVTLVSGTGQGKSSLIRELAYHILENTDDNIGMLMLEESKKRTALGLMSVGAERPLHLPPDPLTFDEWKRRKDAGIPLYEEDDKALTELKKKTFESTVGGKDSQGRSRVWLFDHFGSNDVDTVVNTIEHMAKVGDCKYVFLDHLSILVSDQNNADERKALDEIVTKLRTVVELTGISLFAVSHLRRPNGKPHEEGGQTSLADIRGTAGIGQLSDLVLGLERDGQAENVIERNTTLIRVLKNRYTGKTGPTSSLYYDHKTGRMYELPESSGEEGESDV